MSVVASLLCRHARHKFELPYCFLKDDLFFFIFVFSKNVQLVDKICRCWDLNRRSRVSEGPLCQLSHHPCPSLLIV